MFSTLCRLKPIAMFFIAGCAHIHWAAAQNNTENESKTACPTPQTMKAPQLYGMWQVSFANPPAGLPNTAVMQLEQHQEFSDSLRGTVSRDVSAGAGPAHVAGHASRAALAGDLEGGLLLLDESSNNVSISGTWNGQITEGSCGRQITGVWKDTSTSAPADAPDVRFTLIKRPGW